MITIYDRGEPFLFNRPYKYPMFIDEALVGFSVACDDYGNAVTRCGWASFEAHHKWVNTETGEDFEFFEDDLSYVDGRECLTDPARIKRLLEVVTGDSTQKLEPETEMPDIF